MPVKASTNLIFLSPSPETLMGIPLNRTVQFKLKFLHLVPFASQCKVIVVTELPLRVFMGTPKNVLKHVAETSRHIVEK